MPGGSKRSATRTSSANENGAKSKVTYESIMDIEESNNFNNMNNNNNSNASMMDNGVSAEDKSVRSLSLRLSGFRKWLTNDAKATIHPSVCVVNGEATDGTKNAPVLVFEPLPGIMMANVQQDEGGGRVGMVDGDADQAMYDRTMGCQVRAARELKKDEIMMTVPRSAMITPDLVAASDAGRAIRECCEPSQWEGFEGFWGAFENTVVCEAKWAQKLALSKGTQLLVRILQERRKVEAASNRERQKTSQGENKEHKLAPQGLISTRAVFLAFLIHQRFANDHQPPVASIDTQAANQLAVPADAPATFAPYARTLPTSVSLPICWKRNELALLAGCIPGVVPLQEVAARTQQLAAEFTALLDAGILRRFPETFPEGILTWDRWVWAAAVFTSRVLPVSCYLNEGVEKASMHISRPGENLMQSPPEVWDELGVMIPLLDMLNHESKAHQVTWKPTVPEPTVKGDDLDMTDADADAVKKEEAGPCDLEKSMAHPPQAIVHKRVKKGSQFYCSYGNMKNHELILQYGIAELSNPLDEARLGWGLMDAVGNVGIPNDLQLPFSEEELAENEMDLDPSEHVYESNGPEDINAWWSGDRLSLLEREALAAAPDSVFAMLKSGKKLTAAAHCDGTFHPILLAAAAVGTMPAAALKTHMDETKSRMQTGATTELVISKKHQCILRRYLFFWFSRKLEKLLKNLNDGLKAHYPNVRLWTKASQKGLRYLPQKGSQAEDNSYIGWQTFFDAYAYNATMEVEKQYYAMGPDCCVLTLYDGQLRALQASIDCLSTTLKYEESVIRQLKDLGFSIQGDDGEVDNVSKDTSVKMEEEITDAKESSNTKGTEGVNNKSESTKTKNEDMQGDGSTEKKDGDTKGKNGDAQGKRDETKSKETQSKAETPPAKRRDDSQKKEGKSSSSKRRRNRKKNTGDRPPATKLHIGNLAYSTTPSHLYDFFAGLFGRENVLECHIPTERDSGRSRGFGFVTLPEAVARQALQSSRKIEVDGRILKIAESNSAGAGKGTRNATPSSAGPNERCSTCGYRPRYCVCAVPNLPGNHPNGSGSHMDHPDYNRDHYGSGGRSRGDRYGRSPSPYRRSRGKRDRDPEWDYDRDYRPHRYERSRSPANNYGDDRHRSRSKRDRKARDRSRDRSMDRSRGRSRDRSQERSRDGWSSGRQESRSRKSSRSWEQKSTQASSRLRSRSRSRSSRSSDVGRRGSQGRSSRRNSNDGADSKASASHSNSPPSKGTGEAGGSRAREGRRRSRSRGRGRSRKKKSKRRHARSRSRSASVSQNQEGK